MLEVLIDTATCIEIPNCDVFNDEYCIGNTSAFELTIPPITCSYWGQVTNICVRKFTIIGSDNGLAPDRCQAIIWTNVGISLIGSLGTILSEILIKIPTFPFKKMHLKIRRQDGRHFPDNIFKCIFLNENVWILIKISPKFVPKGPIDNKPALV